MKTRRGEPSAAPNPPEPDAHSRITLFKGVPILELERLTPLLHERVFSAGSTIITADQPGEAVCMILSGSAKVHGIRPDGTEVILAVLGPGEMVGEVSIADSLGRSADVRPWKNPSLCGWIESPSAQESRIRPHWPATWQRCSPGE
jgi:signal-transduction protein with cAMP-binding, CBS, and nucleotidyltransferase domain